MKEFTGHESAYRGEEVVENRQSTKILICGVGALGSWLVDILARQGFSDMTVLDMDKVEVKNFGTQNYSQTDVGRPKALQTSTNLFKRLKVKTSPVNKKLTENNVSMLKGFDLIVDAFDNSESRMLISDYVNNNGLNCVHIGMGNGFGDVTWDNGSYKVGKTNEAVDENGEPCEYPLASNLVHATVLMASESICRFVDEGSRQNMRFALRSMSMESFESN